jgi:hypothetical protein
MPSHLYINLTSANSGVESSVNSNSASEELEDLAADFPGNISDNEVLRADDTVDVPNILQQLSIRGSEGIEDVEDVEDVDNPGSQIRYRKRY